MRVLGIDSSGRLLSVALVDQGRVLADAVLAAGRAHAERLLPAVREVLDRAGGGRPPEMVAVSRGPGSFTGLRAGVMTARTLAYVWRVAVMGLSSLDVLAWQAAVSRAGPQTAVPTTVESDNCHDGHAVIICPLLDARRGQVYAALYTLACSPDPNGGHGLRRLTAHRIWDPEGLGAELRRLAVDPLSLLCHGDVDPAGEFVAAMLAAARLDESCRPTDGSGTDGANRAAEWLSGDDLDPGAVAVARLAWETARRAYGETEDEGTDPLRGPLPLYLRRPAAQPPRNQGRCPD